MFVGDELVHRQQFHRGDAEGFKIVDHRRQGKRWIRAAQLRRHSRMPHRKTFHMKFVDDRLVPRSCRRRVITPAKCRIDDDAFARPRRAVLVTARKVLIRMTDGITKQGIAPL